MTHTEAAQALGMHYLSVMRLKRQGRLRSTLDGGVRDDDVKRYLFRMSRPKGFVEGREAARLLDIPERAIALLARKFKTGTMPRPGGGWWVSMKLITTIKPSELAALGIKVEPPPGWLTREQAAGLIKKSRSWVTRLGRRGTIRRRVISRHNTWYSAEDVERYMVD